MYYFGDLGSVDSIKKIRVAGFKSIVNEQTIEVRPLTILAGTNSSGKSSFMQPLLLLKQTLEAPVDTGPLLLNGPNTKFKNFSELLPKHSSCLDANGFQVSVELEGEMDQSVSIAFERDLDKGISIKSCRYDLGAEPIQLSKDVEKKEVFWQPEVFDSVQFALSLAITPETSHGHRYFKTVSRNRCFLESAMEVQRESGQVVRVVRANDSMPYGTEIQKVLHLPGLRGSPEREYDKLSAGPDFPGTFDSYVASVLASIQATNNETLQAIARDLQFLGLTSKVSAFPLDDSRVELRVGRLVDSGDSDLINISDVGLGVSQVLPVIVACHIAKPGQVVYVEQPEIHLHPSAQFRLARILADAANRGARLVIETHSSLLLLGIQAAVATGNIDANKVLLNWFDRDATTGATTIANSELDQAGRFGDWPVDFDEVALRAQAQYMDAAEAALARK